MVDVALQRQNMVESQVRPSDVTDRRITAAMSELPREAFVPDHMRPLAYIDEEIALQAEKAGQKAARKLLAPRTLAKLIQALDLSDTDVVLDVGCATGYSSAVMSLIAETVVALESDAELAEKASEILTDIGRDNVVIVSGALRDGYASEGPYDAIFVGGEVSAVTEELLDQLKDGGVLVTIEADQSASRAIVMSRNGEVFDKTVCFDTTGPALPGFEAKAVFAL